MIARLRIWWLRRRLWRALDGWQRPTPFRRLKLDTKRWARACAALRRKP